MAYHKQGSQILLPDVLCRYRAWGCIKRRREKAYPGVDGSYPGEINTAWNQPLCRLGQALLAPQGWSSTGTLLSLTKHTEDPEKITVQQGGCVPTYHLGKPADMEQVTWHLSKAVFWRIPVKIHSTGIYQADYRLSGDGSGRVLVKRVWSRSASEHLLFWLPPRTDASSWLECSFCRCDGSFVTNFVGTERPFCFSCSHLLSMITHWPHGLSFGSSLIFRFLGWGRRGWGWLHFCPREFRNVCVLRETQWVENLPAVQETWIQSLGLEDLLEKEMTTHSSTLAWKTPWIEKPGGLQSMGSQRVRHNWTTNTHTSCTKNAVYMERHHVDNCWSWVMVYGSS